MATSGNNPRGFVPTRHLRGDVNFRTRIYKTNSGNLAQIYPGDLVFLDAAGRPQLTTGATLASTSPVGVVCAVYDGNGKPRTHSLPSGGAFAAVSADANIAIWDDPDIIYTVQCDTSVGPGSIGNYIAVTANAPSTAASRSRQLVAFAELTVSALGHPLQIIGIAPNELDAVGGANNDIEVIISNHLYRRMPLTPNTPAV